MTGWQRSIKEASDRIGAVILLAITWPIFLFAAAIIKTFSTGPIFFTQERIGQGGRLFTIYKFRTMRTSASAHRFGNVTVQNDLRLFPGAALLRKYKVDELPQLLNVLNGTMSLVGPRPTVAEDHLRMSPSQQQRSQVKPGLTGLAQIRGGAALPWPQRIEYDLEYIRNYSVWLDLAVMLCTVWLVVTGRADANPAQADEWADHETREDGAPQQATGTPRNRAA